MKQTSVGSTRYPLVVSYLVEGLNSLGASLLAMGIFFYTEHYLHWTPLQNLMLASVQGLVYVGGSLLASPLSRRLAPRAHLGLLHLLLAGVSIAALLWVDRPVMIVSMVVLYAFFSSGNWPVLEGLVSAGATPERLSRRISLYNLIWSGTGAAIVAASGAIIQWGPRGIFLVPLIVHGICLLLIMPCGALNRSRGAAHPAHAGQADPQLLGVRQLALWLSRIALPAAFVVTYGMGAMLPSLPVLAPFDAGVKTMVASVWLVARWGIFLLMGMVTVWHTRPRLLLVASMLLLVGFLGVVVQPSGSWRVNLASMVFWQVGLGAAMGAIYAGSLYFGMVLSDGSTEHGGYHEALIGVGQVLGPAIAGAAQWIRPGDMRFGIGAVAAMVGLSCLAAGVATVRFGRRAGADGMLAGVKKGQDSMAASAGGR